MMAILASGCPRQEAGEPEPKETFVLRFNHVLAPTEPYHQGFLNWAAAVEERTNGGLKIEVFHSAQLGKEEDIIEQLRMGANIGQNTDSARLGMYVPAIAVMNAPYFVDTIDEVLKLRDLPVVQDWIKQLELKFGIKVLSFNWIQGERHMVTNRPIRRPADLAGLRIRTPGAPIWVESVRSLGATPVALPFGEIYAAMQAGAIDGAELVYRNVAGMNLFEVADYLSETRHILLINFSIVGRAWFDSLPEEYQRILIEENEKAGLATSRGMEADVATQRADFVARGMTIVTDVDVEAFRRAGEAAYVALNLVEVRDQIYRELGKTR
jgi:tripartite ATP-independent transporter DctP family solute receptor